MRSALFTLLVVAMTSASASTPPALPPAPVPTPDFIKPPPRPLNTLVQQDDPGQGINPPAPPPTTPIQTVALSPAAEQSGPANGPASAQPAGPPEDAGWPGFAPVAVTLALLGAIAVRRQRAKS